tara:strand:+ start:7164 stop:7403 length:240 start_codon:yes stop_codon:yes gene_type:complete
MNKEDIVKFLRWLGDCYGMDDKKEAERVADEYISENYPKALNIDLVSHCPLCNSDNLHQYKLHHVHCKDCKEDFNKSCG